MIIGAVLQSTNPGVTDPLKYNFTVPMLIFASLGIFALGFAIWLKALNSKHHYGLEDPNIKSKPVEEEVEEAEQLAVEN